MSDKVTVNITTDEVITVKVKQIGPQGPAGPAGADGADGADGATILTDLTDVTLVGLADGQLFTYNAGTGEWNNSAFVVDSNGLVTGIAGGAVNTQVGTTYEFALTDIGKTVKFTSGSPVTATIPANASVAFPVGTVINLAQEGSGQVTVAITSDTLNQRESKLKLAGQYAGATLLKTGTTTWTLYGDLTA